MRTRLLHGGPYGCSKRHGTDSANVRYLFTQGSKVQKLFPCCFSGLFFSLGFKLIQGYLQHDFVRMTDESDKSVALLSFLVV